MSIDEVWENYHSDNKDAVLNEMKIKDERYAADECV